MSADTEPCGSWRVTERLEGHEYRQTWCARVNGPCPYPGTEASTVEQNRRCGALPGKQLFVTYGEDVLQRALADLKRYADSENPTHMVPETCYVAVDALRACLG